MRVVWVDRVHADAKSSGKLAKNVLKPEQLYRYEGEGTAKRKVEISRQERIKLIREAAEKRSD